MVGVLSKQPNSSPPILICYVKVTKVCESLNSPQISINDVMTPEEHELLVARLNNPENLCSNRFIVVRFNPILKQYESLVLGINSTASTSNFSNSKESKIELPGGKYMEYDANGPLNKDAIVLQIQNEETVVDCILNELNEETGIPKSLVKRLKYVGTNSRKLEGGYHKDPNAHNKVSDTYVVEVPPYAQVSINNEGSDDDHGLVEWVPLENLVESVDSPSSKEVLQSMGSRSITAKVFLALRNDVSNKVLNTINTHFDNIYSGIDILHKTNLEKKSTQLKRIENKKQLNQSLNSFIDFTRIDSVRPKHRIDLFFKAFETNKESMESDLACRIKKHFNSALEYEQEHRKTQYSDEFIKLMQDVKMNTYADVNEFIRAYRNHKDYQPIWKEWCLNIFKVAVVFHYLEKAFPHLYELEEHQNAFNEDLSSVQDSLGQRGKSSRKRKKPYEIAAFYANKKGVYRMVDKCLTEKDFDVFGMNDLIRARYVFKNEKERQRYKTALQNKYGKRWGLNWKSKKKRDEIKCEGYYEKDGKKTPMEVQLLLEDSFAGTEVQEYHHDVYVDLIKAYIRDDRLSEVSAEDVEYTFFECLKDPAVLAGESSDKVAKKILKRFREEFIRLPSVQNPGQFAYYSKKNLKNTIGKHLREDEDEFLSNLVRYLVLGNKDKIQSRFNRYGKDEINKFDSSLHEFANDILNEVPEKKMNSLRVLYYHYSNEAA